MSLEPIDREHWHALKLAWEQWQMIHAIHDDEHRPPMCFHGSSLMFKERKPFSSYLADVRALFSSEQVRERMSVGSCFLMEGINNEEGD